MSDRLKETEAPVVVITGASSGIGRSLALAWARRGAKVVLTARDEEGLASVARDVSARGGSAIVIPADVTREIHRVRIVERTLEEAGRIDVLVNNAGRGFYSPVEKIAPDELSLLFELNVFAPLRLSQLALPELEKTRGSIVMMSSIAGVVSAPRMGAYAASKFALEALSMALRAEVAERGIRVVVVRPGPVDTPFKANAINVDGNTGFRPGSRGPQTADLVAEKTVLAVEKERAVVETSTYVQFASFLARTLPGPFRILSKEMAKRADAR
jgi:short-subunit dehydrogenase